MSLAADQNALVPGALGGGPAARAGLASRRGLTLRQRVGRGPGLLVGISATWIVLLIVVSLTVQWLPVHDYATSVGLPNLSPSWGHELLGTDAAGRSMLSRLLYGARTSVMISVVATALGLAVGSLLGVCSAFFGSVISTIGDIIANSILAIPALVLLLGVVLALGSSLTTIMLACAVVFVPLYLRLARAEAARQLARDYIVAARGLGASSRRIIFRELVPNILPSLISFTALVVPSVMIIEGTLSFLGYGVQSPTPSWGNMIALGDQSITTAPWGTLLPCILFGVTIFSMITIGDYLRGRMSAGSSVNR